MTMFTLAAPPFDKKAEIAGVILDGTTHSLKDLVDVDVGLFGLSGPGPRVIKVDEILASVS